MVLMAVGGGGPVDVPQPQNDNNPTSNNGTNNNGAAGAPPAQTPEQKALAAAQAETQRLLQLAQAEMAALKRLNDQGASQADLDNQVKKAESAWGAVQAAVENQMRVAADGGGDTNKAIAGVASDLRNASPKDPVLGEVLDDAQKAVAAESAPQRATNEKAFQFALAVQHDQDAYADVKQYNALPGGVRRADPETGAQLRQAASTADANSDTAYTALTTALRHEYSVSAATLRLDDAKADYAAWQKEPGGLRRADEADITREMSQAQSQYDKVVTGGDDTALTYVTPDEQKQAVASVKQNHDGMWYTGLVDAFGEQSQLNRTIATINPDDPSLSPQMKQLAQSDPVTFALLQDTGQTVDPNDPKLSTQEQALAKQNPLAEAFVKLTGVEVNPANLKDPAEAKALKDQIDQQGVFQYAMGKVDPKSPGPGYQKIKLLLAAAPDVRLQYTKQQVSLLMQNPGSNPGAALQVLKTNMDASFSLDERQTLWTQAGQPHFDANFIHSQIDPLMQKPDSKATDQASMQARYDGRMNADKAGKWMQDILANAPPEFAGVVLDTVKKDFGNKWTQSNTGTPQPYGDGTEFYKGLSKAVGLADQQPTANGEPVHREDDVASWLLDANGNAKTMIYTLRGSDTGYGFDGVRQALSSGVDPSLSKALLSKMQNDDRFRSGFANDFQLRYQQGTEHAQSNQNKQAATASYNLFKADPDKQLKAYFNDFQKNFDGQSRTFTVGSDQLTNFVGAGLGIQPDDPGAVPTDAKDVPSMALLEQMIVGNGQLLNGTAVNSKSLYAQNSAATKMIQTVVDQIRKVGGDHAVVSLVPIYYVSKSTGTAPSALFKVQVEGHPDQYKLIDDRGWKYDTVDDYQHNNALSDDGQLYVPKSLKLDGSPVDLGQYEPIDAHKTEWYQHAEHILEIGTGILAAAGGVVLVASGIGAIGGGPLLGYAMAAIGAGMAVGVPAAIGDLKNLSDHGQSTGFGNAQARGDWISLIGSGAGFAGGGLGVAAKSLAEASSLLRTTGQMSDIIAFASRGEGVTAEAAGLGRFTQEANAFQSLAQTTGRTAAVFNVTGGAIGGYQMVDQGVSLVKNWDAMSDSDRAQQLLNLGIGVAQMGLGSHTLMERPIRAITKTPAPSAPRPTTIDVVHTMLNSGLVNQRLAVGEIGNPWQHAEQQARSFGEPADNGEPVAPAETGLRSRFSAWLRARRTQGTPEDGDVTLLRLAPDAEAGDGAVTPAVAGALAGDEAAPTEAGAPGTVARPASWAIPAHVAADPEILSSVIGSILESGNRLEHVEYYVYALEDAAGDVRVPEEDGLPATERGNLWDDMQVAKADARRARAADDAAAHAAASPDDEGTIGVTRYTAYHDALMVGGEGVAAGRYRIALVDSSALAADGTVPPEAVVGHIGLNDAGNAFVLSMNDAYDRTLHVAYPRGFDPAKPLIRSEDGRRVDVINAPLGLNETQWGAYPRREADLAIYSAHPQQPENLLPAGERPLMPVPPGYFAVYAHAWADAFASATGKPMSADDLAEMVRQSGWDGKSPVILYACGAGTRVTSLAQLLANVLGVDVYGASGFVAWRSPRYRNDGSPASGYAGGIVVEPGAPNYAGVPDHSVQHAPRTYRFSPALAVIDQGAHPVNWSNVALRPVSNRWGGGDSSGDVRVPLGVYVWRVLTRRGSIVNPRSGRSASALEMTHALEDLAWKGYTPGVPVALEGPHSGADPALLQEFADLIQAPVFGRLGDDDAAGWRRAIPNPGRRLARFQIEPDVNGKFSPGRAQPVRINPLELRPVPGSSVVNLLGHATARQFLKVSGFDIAESHGTKPRDVSWDSSAAVTQGGSTMSPREFARKLLEDPAYTEGNGVLLTGCYLGSGGYPFAQELAYELQVPVIASIASNSVRGTGALFLHPNSDDIVVPAHDPDVSTRLYLHIPETPDANEPPMVFARRGEPMPGAAAHGDAPVEPVRPIEAQIDPEADSGRRGNAGTPEEAGRPAPGPTPRGPAHPRLAPEPDAGEPPVYVPPPLVEVGPGQIFTADEWAARTGQAAEAEADDGLSGIPQKIYPKSSRVYTDRRIVDDGVVTTTVHGQSVLQPGFDDVTGVDATQHPEFLRPADTLLMPPDDPLHAIGARGLMSPPGHHVVFGHGMSADAMLGPEGRPMTPDEVAERVAPLLEPEQDVTLYSCFGGSNKHDPLRVAPGQVRAASTTFAAALAQRLSEITGRPISVWAPPDILLVEHDGSTAVRGTRLTGQVDKDRLPMQSFRGDPTRAGRPALPAAPDAQPSPAATHTAARPMRDTPARPTVPRVPDPTFADPGYDFTAIPDDTFESVTLDHPFRSALTDRPGVIGDAARVTRAGGTVSQHWPSYFLDDPQPTRVIDGVMQAFDEAGLTNLRVEFVTRDGSIVLGSGTDFGALDPEDGWFRFSGTVPDATAAATHAQGRATPDGQRALPEGTRVVAHDDLGQALDAAHPGPRNYAYVPADALPDETVFAQGDLTAQERVAASATANLAAVDAAAPADVVLLSALGHDPASALRVTTPGGELFKPAGVDMYVVRTRDAATGDVSYRLVGVDRSGLPEGYAAVHAGGTRAVGAADGSPTWPMIGPAGPAASRLTGPAGNPSGAPTPAAAAGHAGAPAVPEGATVAAAAEAQASAAAWLDSLERRTLTRVDGAHAPTLDGLARRLGPNAHVLVAVHAARPAADAEHAPPTVVAVLETDANGALGPVRMLDGKRVPNALKKALTNAGSKGRNTRRSYDFYVSPVAHDELMRFGGPSTIKTPDGKSSWSVAASNRQVDGELAADIAKLQDAPRFKRPRQAVRAVEGDRRWIHVIDDETGKVLGYAERNADHEWKYYEKAPLADTEIPEQDLRAVFRRQRRGGIPVGRSPRRGIRFVASDVKPETVDRIGGFRPAKEPDTDTKPRRTAGDTFQSIVPTRRPLVRADAEQGGGGTASRSPLVDPHLLPSDQSAFNAVDFSGNSVPHLLTAIRNGSVSGGQHVIYVFETDGPVAEALGDPRGVIAERNGEMRWFDNVRDANNASRNGVALDEMPIGTDRFGADMHFLLTQLSPREFLKAARPTRVAALEAREQALLGQLRDAEARGRQSAPFRALAARTRLGYNEVRGELQRLRRSGFSRNGAALETLAIEPYQPGLSSTTVVEFNLRNGAAKPEQYFPTHEQVEAFNKQAQRAGNMEDLVLKGEPQAVMVDVGMWRTLLNKLYVARDVPTSSSRFLPVPGRQRTRRFGAATVADKRIRQFFTRSNAQLQDRMVPMARSFSLSDDPALMTKQVERHGGVMPVVTLVVDPHSLAAALGKAHDPDFLRAVDALGDQKNAVFDGENGMIHPAPGTDGKVLALDDLAHLHRWLDEAARSGFAIRLETAPSRALVSGADYRFQSGTNDTYHDYVRMFTALERWANANPGVAAPNVMVTFHGWDAVPESVPGGGHEKLLRAVLERNGLEWVHMGLSYGTHGADFIGNHDLTGALAKLIVEYRNRPDVIGRLHGADALTRVFERVDRQTLANQHQLLFAEVERIGAAHGMTPADVAALRQQLYEGNTTVWLNQARKATIEHAMPLWEADGNPPRNETERGARTFGARWLEQYGAGVPDRVTTRARPAAADPLDHWRAVVRDPALINDGTKPIGASRREAAQLAQVAIPDAKRAQAELHALRVHDEPIGDNRPPPSPRRIAGDITAAAVTGGAGAGLLIGLGRESVRTATNSLYAGLRVGRVFQALHHGAVASLKNGDPRVFDRVVDRLVRGLQTQLKANGFDVAGRGAQLEQIAYEGKAKAAQLRALNDDGQLSFDDTVTHTKAIAADMLAQMQGVVGGTSLKLLHHGSPRHSIGRIGRVLALGGYAGSITMNVARAYATGDLVAGGQAVGGLFSAAYTGIVYKGSLRGVNAENRSQLARTVSATGDYLTSAMSIASGIHTAMTGDPYTGTLTTMSGVLLGAGRLHSHFPNATPWLERLPTGIALAPVAIFGVMQGISLITSATASDDKHKTPGSSTNHSGSNAGTPTPGASLAPSPGATTAPAQPNASATPSQPSASATPSQPAQPPSSSPSATPLTVNVVAGDSLWTIAERHEGSLLAAAHVPADQQQRMSDGQRINVALNEILQLNRNLASNPGEIAPGQQVIVG
ncbi:LysM repeat protein [Burkholderia ambifaria]|nr:LWXIA domain-containing protein [Burkholderia ambifaria]MDR6500852.1 LysM repeat protein [Burkholderia ambifaria]